MTLPGKARQFPYLAISALSIAAVGVTAPAWAPEALASAEHATTSAAPPPDPRPATGPRPAAANSAIAGYVLPGDPTGYDTYDSADSAAGAVTVTSIGTGIFKVVFADLASIAGAAAPQVTVFNPADRCALSVPVPAGRGLAVIVSCIRVATGNPASDAEFDLVVTRPVHPAAMSESAGGNR
jgi:hypothetical protein